MRQPRVAEVERGEIDGEEPARVQHGRGAVRRHAQREHRQRVETRGRQRDAPHPPRAHPAHGQPDDAARGELEDEQTGELPPGPAMGAGEGDDEDHDGRVVEAGLRLQQAADPGRQRHPAQHREDGRRVGRRQHGADEHRVSPVDVEQHVGRAAGDEHRDRRADRRERRGGRHHGTDLLPRGGQAAFGEDHDEGGEAERLRHFLVVEVQPERILTQQQAEPEVEQQRGQPAADREPHRGDGDQQHDGADQEQQVELMDRHVPLLPPSGSPSFPMAGVSSEPEDLARRHGSRDRAVVGLRGHDDGTLAVVQQREHRTSGGTRASARS